MKRHTLSRIIGLLSSAFVKLRVLQVLMVCAVVIIFIRIERLYSLSDDIFVQGAKAQQKAEDKKDPKADATPAPAAAPAPAKKEEAPTAPAPEATKAGFTSESKNKEGFKAESFDILELSPEQVEVLRTLSKRHRDLVQRERSISEREATLQAIEQRLDQKTSEMKKIQEYLKELLGQKDEKEKESIKKLVIVYEKMKPVEAATILQELDLETLLTIMDEMKDGKVSAIIAKMEPVRARFLTMELAQRRKKLEEKMKQDHESAADLAKLTPVAAPVTPESAPKNAVAPDSTKPAAPEIDKSGPDTPAPASTGQSLKVEAKPDAGKPENSKGSSKKPASKP